MNDNGWRGGKRDNNDGPPDLDEIFRSLNQKLSRAVGRARRPGRRLARWRTRAVQNAVPLLAR